MVERFRGDDPCFLNFRSDWVSILYLKKSLLIIHHSYAHKTMMLQHPLVTSTRVVFRNMGLKTVISILVIMKMNIIMMVLIMLIVITNGDCFQDHGFGKDHKYSGHGASHCFTGNDSNFSPRSLQVLRDLQLIGCRHLVKNSLAIPKIIIRV